MLNCFVMQSFSWKNTTFIFVLGWRWNQGVSSLAERAWPPCSHSTPLRITGLLPEKWHRREKETINTHVQQLFTDVHWQERSKETRLSSQPQGERVLMIPDLCSCSQHIQLPPSSSSAPASPTSPSHSCLPARSSPTPWLLPPLSSHPVRWYMLAAQCLGRLPGLVKTGEKPNIH